MNTITSDATGASGDSYPARAGTKTALGPSNEAAVRVDSDPDRKLSVYTQIALTSILSERGLTIDHVADQIGEHLLYARPRGTELVQLGVLQYGPKRPSPTTGRPAGTIQPSGALVEFLGRHEPADDRQLERLTRMFIRARVEEARSALRTAKHGWISGK